jgi:hypothetical protein
MRTWPAPPQVSQEPGCARRRPTAAAGGAVHDRGELDLGGGSEHGLFEVERELVAQVGAAEGAAAAAAPAAAEDVAEHVAEDVAERVAGVEARAAATRRVEARMAELVVGRAFLRIGEDLVGLLGLLELLFRLRVVRIAVRVVFHGEAPVGLLDVLLGGVSRHRQHLVIIAFRHARAYDPPDARPPGDRGSPGGRLGSRVHAAAGQLALRPCP